MVLIGLIVFNTGLCFTVSLWNVGLIFIPEEIIPCARCLRSSCLLHSTHTHFLQAVITHIGLLRQLGLSLGVSHVTVSKTHTTPTQSDFSRCLTSFHKTRAGSSSFSPGRGLWQPICSAREGCESWGTGDEQLTHSMRQLSSPRCSFKLVSDLGIIIIPGPFFFNFPH